MINSSHVLSTFGSKITKNRGNVNHVNRFLDNVAKTGEMLIILIIFGTFAPPCAFLL